MRCVITCHSSIEFRSAIFFSPVYFVVSDGHLIHFELMVSKQIFERLVSKQMWLWEKCNSTLKSCDSIDLCYYYCCCCRHKHFWLKLKKENKIHYGIRMHWTRATYELRKLQLTYFLCANFFWPILFCSPFALVCVIKLIFCTCCNVIIPSGVWVGNCFVCVCVLGAVVCVFPLNWIFDVSVM